METAMSPPVRGSWRGDVSARPEQPYETFASQYVRPRSRGPLSLAPFDSSSHPLKMNAPVVVTEDQDFVLWHGKLCDVVFGNAAVCMATQDPTDTAV